MLLSIRADLFAVEPTAAFSVTFLASFRFGIFLQDLKASRLETTATKRFLCGDCGKLLFRLTKSHIERLATKF